MSTTMSASPAIAAVPGTSGRAWALASVSALVGGVLLGILTNLGQGWLPNPWDQIANSGAVWSVSAFVAGALLARKVGLPAAVVAGQLAELGLVVGYYAYAEFARDGMGSLFAPLIWVGMAFIAGPLFGVAAVWWRGESPRRRVIGLAALAGVFGMEGLHYAWVLQYAPQAWACLAVCRFRDFVSISRPATWGVDRGEHSDAWGSSRDHGHSLRRSMPWWWLYVTGTPCAGRVVSVVGREMGLLL
ncbi:DUF6518 family protein [Streptomyces sp. NPDC004111]|uniref:DUF6518 family protein n=1 Tax=Streptomyces sp. NPDC004111 TaxID=3364690 RepID=UPI0036737092